MWPGVAVRAPSLPLVVRGRPGEGVALSVLDRGRFPRTGHRDGRGIAFCAVELYTKPVAYPCAHHTSSLCSAIVLRRRSSASHNVTRPSTLVLRWSNRARCGFMDARLRFQYPYYVGVLRLLRICRNVLTDSVIRSITYSRRPGPADARRATTRDVRRRDTQYVADLQPKLRPRTSDACAPPWSLLCEPHIWFSMS